ncbi:hypothetical protein ccbrp13_70910 [Ktedonobacteria bacterium brp13]|nr:hypothetical protein ccbrp13_70910 [Ktedonobacteria bacterium brp13]
MNRAAALGLDRRGFTQMGSPIAVSNTLIPESIQNQTRHTLANLVLLRLADQYFMHSSVTS